MPGFFPLWVVITHFLNIFFMLLLARSGLEVLSAFPKLYWHDDSPPGRQWLRLSKKTFAADSRRPWTTLDEEVSWSPAIALPGRKNLGLGRHWHFLTVQFWILTGAVYVALVFATGYWRYLIPEHWSIVPDSIKAIGTYLHFQIPARLPGQPFEAAQKLTYFLLIFVLAPLQVLSGAAMSPAIIGRFPRYSKLFGGKQGARSWHFIGLCLFAAFTALHTFMVIVHGLPSEFVKIVLGGQGSRALALGVGLADIFCILLFHVVISWFSLRYRRRTQRLLGFMVNPFERVLSRAFASRQRFGRHRSPPTIWSTATRRPAGNTRGWPAPGSGTTGSTWAAWWPARSRCPWPSCAPWDTSGQVTKHNCIQGWTGIAEWGGVPLARLIEVVKPRPEARHVVFYAMDDKGLTEGEGRYGFFYGSIPMYLAVKPQTLLALDMNGAPLPVEHGAPLRLRIETQLGFKMVKWIAAIEFVTSTTDIGQGQGGWREDQQYYANAAGI